MNTLYHEELTVGSFLNYLLMGSVMWQIVLECLN